MSRNPAQETRFNAWLENHRGILFKVARSFAPNPADEGDLLQEIQLQLWNSIPAYAGQAKESTWIYRVCLNTALAWRRGSDRRKNWIEPDADVSQVKGTSPSPADVAGQHELLEQLYTAIHRLENFDRALVLLMLDGVSYREIAEVTGLTENHVGVVLTRARKRLATLMKGVTDELE